jgi:hypothetical protein
MFFSRLACSVLHGTALLLKCLRHKAGQRTQPDQDKCQCRAPRHHERSSPAESEDGSREQGNCDESRKCKAIELGRALHERVVQPETDDVERARERDDDLEGGNEPAHGDLSLETT